MSCSTVVVVVGGVASRETAVLISKGVVGRLATECLCWGTRGVRLAYTSRAERDKKVAGMTHMHAHACRNNLGDVRIVLGHMECWG